MKTTKLLFSAALAAFLSSAIPAGAELPDAATLLGDLGYSADDIATIKAGEIAKGEVKQANERDLSAAFAFYVKASPAELVKDLRAGLLNDVDPNTLATGEIKGSIDDFAALKLAPDTDSRAKRYRSAAPGDDLNLSGEEIAAFKGLGDSADAAAVEKAVRSALLARYEAYKSKGLGGIASYDRGSGEKRDVAADLRSQLQSMKGLQKYAPAFYAMANGYPGSKVSGSEEVFRWMHFNAHDVPTIALVHGIFAPDGDAILALQRQYYVSEGFNGEQAIAAFLPVQGGTVVLYANHTSTDQVAGFGGGAKRSIGSSLLSSQLQDLFSKLQKEAPK